MVISARGSGLSSDAEWRTMVHVRMDGIDKRHAHDLLAMARGEQTDVKSAEVAPNENVRAGNPSAG
ncbi:MAG TPA: hypothetical protein VJX16_10280 [Terriglobales bacterium]|nr:hypothetical protein [Terriglobales bacterium]